MISGIKKESFKIKKICVEDEICGQNENFIVVEKENNNLNVINQIKRKNDLKESSNVKSENNSKENNLISELSVFSNHLNHKSFDIRLNNDFKAESKKIEITNNNLLNVLIKQKANRNWNLILNTVFLINKMRKVKVKRLMTDDLQDHYENWFLNNKIDTIKENFSLKDSPTSATQNVYPRQKQYKIHNQEEIIQLDLIAKQSRLFSYVASGSEENLWIISELINNDPNKYMYDFSQKNMFFVNQKNENFITALYVATINGHLKIVKFLCENGANHLIRNGVKYINNRNSMMESLFSMHLLDGKCYI